MRTRRNAAGTKPPSERGEDDNPSRRDQILQEAARLFGTQGFDATTIRDIAAAAGILGGSIYYHFSSKEDIFLAVHSTGIERISNAVLTAISGIEDPWEQLEAAAVAHCNTLLALGELPVRVSSYYSHSLKDRREELIAQRDNYEKIIAGIVGRLDLPSGVDSNVFRLHFLGALNWIPTWYRDDGGKDPSELGRQLVAMLRH